MDTLVQESKIFETQAERSKRKRDRYLSDLRFLLKNVEGRRFIWGVFTKCGTFVSPKSNNNDDTNMFIGRQQVGLDLLNDILEAKPEAFTQMQQEFVSETKSEEFIDKKITENSSVLG